MSRDRSATASAPAPPGSRGQANVVGVALLVGLTVVAMASLTLAVGGLVDATADRAAAERAATQIEQLVAPSGPGTRRTATLHLGGGSLHTPERQLRLLRGGRVVHEVGVGALVLDVGDRRATHVAGAVFRGDPPGALRQGPTLRRLDGGPTRRLVVGVTDLDGDVDVAGEGSLRIRLAATLERQRRSFPTARYAVAVETDHAAALADHYRAAGATVERRDLDGDGVPSAIARFDRRREVTLVVARVEVSRRG